MKTFTVRLLNIIRVSEILIVSFLLVCALVYLYNYYFVFMWYNSSHWINHAEFAYAEFLTYIVPLIDFGYSCYGLFCLSFDYFWVKAILITELFYFVVMNFIEYCVFGKCTFYYKVFFHKDDYK